MAEQMPQDNGEEQITHTNEQGDETVFTLGRVAAYSTGFFIAETGINFIAHHDMPGQPYDLGTVALRDVVIGTLATAILAGAKRVFR